MIQGASVYPACQNLLLAARGLGYGGVMTGWHGGVEDELRALLGIPDETLVAATIPLGRPLGSHGPVRRLPLADIVYDGAWGEPAEWANLMNVNIDGVLYCVHAVLEQMKARGSLRLKAQAASKVFVSPASSGTW